MRLRVWKLNAYSEVELAFAGSSLKQLARALLAADWERFFQVLNSFLATINYELHIKQERYYQTIFYLIFKLIGLEISAEVHTNQGRTCTEPVERIDAVIETDEAAFIFEFKLDGSAAEALAQTCTELVECIRQRKYFAPYLLREKPLHLVGVNFNMEKREVGAWEAAV